MKKFPEHLKPENISEFKNYQHKKYMNKLRSLITDYIYDNENNGFDLCINENSNFLYLYKNGKMKMELINQVRNELESLGWKTKLLYGDTSLFIYTNEKELPMNGMDGELI